MKNKLKGFIVLVIGLFMFPILVFADVGAPEITEYEVRVTNKNGATLYGWSGESKGILPYDTKVTVYYEYDNKGKLYGAINYNNESYDIDLSDFEVIEKNVDLSKFNKLDKPVKVYVFGDDCYMFNGPSRIYGKVSGESKIPVGTELEYEYTDGIYSYVEYNGTKGWIITYTLTSLYNDYKISVGKLKDNGKVFIVKNLNELEVDVNGDKTKSVKISAGDELTYDYYVDRPKSRSLHINDNGIEGWLTVSEGYWGEDTIVGSAKYDCGKLYVGKEDGIDIYKNARDVNSKTGKKLDFNTLVDLEYSFTYDGYIWYKVKDEDKEYWVAEKVNPDFESKIVINTGWNYIYKIKEDVTMYEEMSDKSKEIKKVKSGTKVNSIFVYYEISDIWIYTEIDGDKGWIKVSKYEFEDYIEICSNLSQEEPVEEKKDDKEEKAVEKKLSMSTKEILLIAVSGAVVLALVVVVIIKIVNKKKVS